MQYITTEQLREHKVKFYAYVVEPVKLKMADDSCQSAWSGSVVITLEDNSEKVWHYGYDQNAGELFKQTKEAFDELIWSRAVQII